VRLFDWFTGRKSVSNSLDLFREIYGGRTSKTGQTVTLADAMRCAAAMACARVIANGIAQVPLKLFQEQGDSKTPATDHPLYRVLHRRPNPWQTSFEFRETIGLHLAFCGRAYVYKTIVGGKVRELIPFEPGAVTTKLAADGISIIYRHQSADGTVREFDQELIWHLKGPSWNGWEGLDAMELARDAVGLTIATETQHANTFKNGVTPSGVYTVEGNLNPEQHKQLRAFLAANYSGENQGLPMVIDRGAKWLQTAMKGVDAQHLETRMHQVREVCRAMGVMPIMVFADDRTQAFASVEALYQAHVAHTLAPWWERLEQSIDCNLLTERDERDGIYAKFMGQGLLRGSMKDRAEYFSKALGSGGSPAWMTPDEVRSLEELNPMGGDAALLPKPTNVAPRPDDSNPEDTANA
jgi:HK97 family phage portal protein